MRVRVVSCWNVLDCRYGRGKSENSILRSWPNGAHVVNERRHAFRLGARMDQNTKQRYRPRRLTSDTHNIWYAQKEFPTFHISYPALNSVARTNVARSCLRRFKRAHSHTVTHTIRRVFGDRCATTMYTIARGVWHLTGACVDAARANHVFPPVCIAMGLTRCVYTK